MLPLHVPRRLIPRVVWALFFICFFVVFSGFGIFTRLPDSSPNDLPLVVEYRPAQNQQSSKNGISESREFEKQENKFDSYQEGLEQWLVASPPSTPDMLMVYSAYWDSRVKPPCVRVIGAALTKRTPNVYCRLHFADGKTANLSAQKKPINEHWNLKYAGFIFSCCSAGLGPPVPTAVTLFQDANKNVSATLRVRANPRGDELKYKGQIALCVKPFHYNYNRATWLVEFFEFYRMMGVDFFLLYNESVGEEVQKVLLYYQNKDILQVLPWKMLVKNQKEVRTENMFAALNDCNYRLMYLYRYVIFVDFDEYIVPRQHENLTSMLASLSVSNDKNSCVPSYIFENVFFYLYWSNDTSLFGAEPETYPKSVPYLLTQYKTRRLKEPHRHGKRSKFIALPERVLEVGNHITWRHTSSCKPYKVGPEVALLHHYRICEYGGFECLKLPSVQDRTAHKLGNQLLNRVTSSCQEIFKQNEGQCPISPPLGSPW